jgi:dolichyl-phosphate-mannose-protein mannosyltransferase
MAIIKKMINKLKEWSRKEYFWPALLALLVLTMHLSIILYPNAIVLDETYYVNDVRGFIDGGTQIRAEHPPLGEVFIMTGIRLFGDNSFGWRIIAVLMGSASVFLFYLICRRLAMSRRATIFASILYAFETLTFTQSSVVMPDVYMLFFMILCLWLYLRGNYPLAIAAGVLAGLCKLNGLFVLLIIGFHWIITRRDRKVIFIASAIAAPLLFYMLLPLGDYVLMGKLLDPIKRIYDMLSMGASVTFIYANHPSAFRPWEWFIFMRGMPYNYQPYYTAVISPAIWALIIPILTYMVWRMVKGSRAAMFGVIWFAVTYLLWIPLVLTTDRVTYIYYFCTSMGALCIGLGLGLSELVDFGQSRERGKLRKFAIIAPYVYLILHFGAFVALTPVFTRL